MNQAIAGDSTSPRLGSTAPSWLVSLTLGLALSLVVWCLWFVTHLPWLGLSESTSMPIILVGWLLGAIAAGWCHGVNRVMKVGPLAGLISGLAGLPALGTKLAHADPSGTGSAQGVRPDATLIVLGFLLLATVVGGVGLFIGGRARGPRPPQAIDDDGYLRWVSRLALVAVAAAAPLLFVGGLVTSTASGMAVPDWPNTFGSNMFLYPLGPRAAPDVYLEHSHRLFGTLVGLATMCLMACTLGSRARGWVKGWAVALFVFVCIQGLLGGLRVRVGNPVHAMDDRLFRTIHGVLSQFVLAGAVALAVYLTPTYRLDAIGAAMGRKVRAFATGATHALFLQLIFGAMYRHMRSPHALWSHIGFSFVVVVLVILAGMFAYGLREDHPLTRTLRRLGPVAIAVLGVQFLLGWAVFLGGGSDLKPETIAQALLRTAHQANGAALLGVVTALAVFARRLRRD